VSEGLIWGFLPGTPPLTPGIRAFSIRRCRGEKRKARPKDVQERSHQTWGDRPSVSLTREESLRCLGAELVCPAHTHDSAPLLVLRSLFAAVLSVTEPRRSAR
jgi:hypothetical protein